MSRLYDTIEPSVIDEVMLNKAVYDQGPKDEAGRLAKEEGLKFENVEHLRLDYKNILKIDNLWCFANLTKLQLDNNIIEKIEGLDHIVNLKWLDLSFNNIEVIEGLSSLSQLEDLTLFNNRIELLENLNHLKKLQILSIGNNKLGDLENLKYLRQLPSLNAINLTGNPVCNQDGWKEFFLAFVPARVVYLDYRLIDEEARKAAMDAEQMHIELLQTDEREAERKELQLLEDERQQKLYFEAFVDNLDRDQLFESMYSEDQEGIILNDMPGFQEIVAQFKEKFQLVCKDLFKFGLKEHDSRKEEVSAFWESINEAKLANKAEGVAQIAQFEKRKKEVFDRINDEPENSAVTDELIAKYKKDTDALHYKLMGLEIQLVDQLEETIKDFERNLGELVARFKENMEALTGQCRELENQHYERLQETAIVILEKVLKNELEDDISEELRMMFVDKDTVMNALATSHDVHLLKIDNKADEMTGRIQSWSANLMNEIHRNEEITRNRERVLEINSLIDHLKEEIDNLDLGGDAVFS